MLGKALVALVALGGILVLLPSKQRPLPFRRRPLPTLPPAIIDRILVYACTDYCRRYGCQVCTKVYDRLSRVSRQSRRAILQWKWANRRILWSTRGVKQLMRGSEKPYVVAVDLIGFSDAWIRRRVAQLASSLVYLYLTFKDEPGDGLRALRGRSNLERLALSCPARQRGDLGAVFATVGFLPRLEQLSIQHFNVPESLQAPQKGRRKPRIPPTMPTYTFPSTFTSLDLCAVGGRNLLDFLLDALEPSFLHTLSSLFPRLDGLTRLRRTLFERQPSAIHDSSPLLSIVDAYFLAPSERVQLIALRRLLAKRQGEGKDPTGSHRRRRCLRVSRRRKC